MSRRIRILFLAAAAAAISLAVDHSALKQGEFGMSRADARVGRPLTPVSVAGVARRTARRCAAGVYNC
jgi:hypothetical protein